MLQDRHLPEELQEPRFLLLDCRSVGFFAEDLLHRRRNDQNLFPVTYAPEVFFGVLVFVLEGVHVLQFPAGVFVAAGHDGVLAAHVPERAVEEDVSVKGERETERHEPHDRKADDNRKLPTEWFCSVEGHDRN